jgi:hypothetical protein
VYHPLAAAPVRPVLQAPVAIRRLGPHERRHPTSGLRLEPDDASRAPVSRSDGRRTTEGFVMGRRLSGRLQLSRLPARDSNPDRPTRSRVSYRWTSREDGQGGRIRTNDPLLPRQVLYQAELHPDGDDGGWGWDRTSTAEATDLQSATLSSGLPILDLEEDEVVMEPPSDVKPRHETWRTASSLSRRNANPLPGHPRRRSSP